MSVLEILGIIASVVAGLKAIEWIIQKINNTHDKSRKVDENTVSIEDFKKHTNEVLSDMQKQINDGHKYSTIALNDLKKEITEILESHREEYLKGIDEVKHSVTEMSSVYQQTVAIIELKIDNLEKKQDKHNSIIERTYALEKEVGILQNRESVSEHRLTDLESKS